MASPDPVWIFAVEYQGLGGSQPFGPPFNNLAAWAVRPGDVAAVPEPGTWLLALSGPGLCGARATRRRRG